MLVSLSLSLVLHPCDPGARYLERGAKNRISDLPISPDRKKRTKNGFGRDSTLSRNCMVEVEGECGTLILHPCDPGARYPERGAKNRITGLSISPNRKKRVQNGFGKHSNPIPCNLRVDVESDSGTR